MAKKRNWYQLGNEVMDGVHNVANRVWRNATFREDSLGMRSMERVADVMTAGAGVSGMTYNLTGAVGGAVGTSLTAPVNAINNGIESYHDRIWNGYPHPITDPEGADYWPDEWDDHRSDGQHKQIESVLGDDNRIGSPLGFQGGEGRGFNNTSED